MTNIEVLLSELGRASMCSDDSTYNGITEKQSSESYRLRIKDLYSNAVSVFCGLNESQRRMVIKRIDEERENQKYFDVPSQVYVDSLLRDYNNQPDGKRNKSLLDDYRFCTFVLECVAIQKEYLEKFASLVTVEKPQVTTTDTKPDEDTVSDSNSDTSKETSKNELRVGIKEAIDIYRLPKSIKDPKWRKEHGFPTKDFEDKRERKTKVFFYKTDIEDWINSDKKKRK